jgi:endonuclease/exonuclease/phosphatase (EEP) superfamily protein YafD
MIRILALLATSVPIIGTILSLIRHPHWVFRLWDFPRVQMATLMSLGAPFLNRRRASDRVLMAAAAASVAWQIHKIHPYTRIVAKQVKDAEQDDLENSISLLMSNVLMENEDHETLIEVVRQREPDVLLAVETDEAWVAALEEALGDEYPHRIKQPQDNYYGMVVFSKLEMKAKVRFLVQDDIPSIHARLRLRSGTEVELHALHPRPPEPLRDQRSTPRDAELVIVGKAIEKKRDVPTIVAGDLNDVAWSDTSELFVRLSQLLDPRIGRGFYNSYSAKNPFARFPLDHIFHSNHFKLIHLERLPPIGSDHFPIFAHLLYAPEAKAEQEPAKKESGDEKRASEKLAKEREDAATGKDRPS